MKLPRNTVGEELAFLLGRYGYCITRQTGSHMRLTSNYKITEHHITNPKHKPLRTGTLSSIVKKLLPILG